MTEQNNEAVDYVVVPDDDNFDPHYVPEEDEPGDFEEHPDIPEDLSDFE
jgi:hypothetical protein